MRYCAITLLTLLILPYLVTIGSAAWFGPHLAKVPLPIIPVLPTGFLLKQIFGHCYLHNTNLLPEFSR